MSGELAIRILSRQVEAAEEELEAWKAAHRDAAIADELEDIIRLAERMPDVLASSMDSFEEKVLADKLDPSGPGAQALRRVVHHSLSFLSNVRDWADSLAERGYSAANRATLNEVYARVEDLCDRVDAIVPPDEAPTEDAQAREQLKARLREKLPPEKFLELAQESPPPQSWYDETGKPL
jgi:hypothetical protein